MKKKTLKQGGAEYITPSLETIWLTAETSLMLSGSGLEEGEYEEDEW